MAEIKETKNQKLSVLFVTTNLNYNGAKKYMVEVAGELVSRGHRVGLLYDNGPLAKKLDKKVNQYHLKLSGLGINPISRLKLYLKAALIARKDKYAIIHGESSSSSISQKMFKFYSGAAIVETIHQVWNSQKDRKNAAARIPKRADLSIAISKRVVAIMKDAGLKTSSKKLTVLTNGIDTKEFKYISKTESLALRKEIGIGPKDPVLVWVARVAKEKNLEALINWLPYLLADFPNLRFVIVGDNGSGNRDYLNIVIRKIKALGLSKNIICVGGQVDVKKYLSIGQIFTINSWTARDLSVMEAMAAGLPVVVSKYKNSYPPDLVTTGETGFTFEWGRWNLWAQHIKYLLKKPAVAKKFGEAGKKRVNQYFSIERYVDALEKVYRKVLGA